MGRIEEGERLTRTFPSFYDKLWSDPVTFTWIPFVAVYGRRRVGKTYLIDETFEGRITFRHAGLAPKEEETDKSQLHAQLDHFYSSLELFVIDEYRQGRMTFVMRI